MASKIASAVLSALFPDRCTACETPLFVDDLDPAIGIQANEQAITSNAVKRDPSEGAFSEFASQWCNSCWDSLALKDRLQCDFCAAEMREINPLGGGCPLCYKAKLRFDRAICLGNYEGLLRDLVIQMKNQHDDHVAMQLAKLLVWKLEQQFWGRRIDLIVPVPTHWRRRLLRGFCAAEILADTVARETKIEMKRNLASFTRVTEKQGRLSITKRRKNMVGAMKLKDNFEFTDRVILIVDDVMTSGATVSELAKALKKRGAAAVFVVVCARGAGVS